MPVVALAINDRVPERGQAVDAFQLEEEDVLVIAPGGCQHQRFGNRADIRFVANHVRHALADIADRAGRNLKSPILRRSQTITGWVRSVHVCKAPRRRIRSAKPSHADEKIKTASSIRPGRVSAAVGASFQESSAKRASKAFPV